MEFCAAATASAPPRACSGSRSGAKLPENLRVKAVTLKELSDDALTHSKAENSERQTCELPLRIDQILAEFGSRPADSIRKNEIVAWLAKQAEARNWPQVAETGGKLHFR
jgi:hypothetical protein